MNVWQRMFGKTLGAPDIPRITPLPDAPLKPAVFSPLRQANKRADMEALAPQEPVGAKQLLSPLSTSSTPVNQTSNASAPPLTEDQRAKIDKAIELISTTVWVERQRLLSDIEAAIQLMKTIPGSDMLLIKAFHDNRYGGYGFARRYLGSALAQIGRKDVLIEEIKKARHELGKPGQWHSYWSEVLDIADMFVDAKTGDAADLALQAMTNRESAEWETNRIEKILRSSLKDARSKIPEQTLKKMCSLPNTQTYKHGGNSWQGDDSITTEGLDFSQLKAEAEAELNRRSLM